MNIRTRRLLTLASCVAVVLIVAGVIALRLPRGQIVIADAQQPGFLLLYIAEHEGYFADENLIVDFRPFTLGKDALQDVMDGNADVATVFDTPVVNRVIAGDPVRILTSLHSASENTALITRRDRVPSVADLAGKKVALTRGTSSEFFLSLLLETNGFEPKDVTVVDAAPGDLQALLEKGTVDAIVYWYPERLAVVEAMGQDRVDVLTLPFTTEMSVLASREDVVRQKQEAFRLLLRALVRAQDFLSDHPETAKEILAASMRDKRSGMRVQEYVDRLRYKVGIDHRLVSLFQDEARWALARRGEKNPETFSILPFISADALMSADPLSVTYQ